MRQLLAGTLMATLAFGTYGISTAQVGPSPTNIRKPKATHTRVRPKNSRRKTTPAVTIKSKPIVRIRPVPPVPPVKPPTAVAVVKPKPPAPVSPAVKAAQKWQADELRAVEVAARAGAGLTAPKLGSVRFPAAPAPGPKPEPELVYVQKVTLKLAREDGGGVDSKLVRPAGGTFQVRYGTGVCELEGPRVKQGDPAVKLELPADWGFVEGGGASLALGGFPGEETRTELPARVDQTPRQLPGVTPLFATEQEKAALRGPGGSKPRVTAAPAISAYPTPGAHGLAAIARLVEARRLIDQCVPVPAGASVDERRKAWLDLDAAVRLLGEADTALKMAQKSYSQLRTSNKAKQVLKADYKLKYDNHLAWLSAARVRRAQYLSEAEWWKAECENPVNPDRTPALQAIRDVRGSATETNEVQAQLARYSDIAQQEANINARLRSGEYDRRSIPRVQVTHHLTLPVKLQRVVVDFRIPKAELLASDVITLPGSTTPIPFTLEGNFWKTRLPRSQAKPGAVLLLSRKSQGSEMQSELRQVKADPYNFDGNALDREGMRLVAIRGYAIGDTANNIRLFEELDAADRPNSKLANVRKKAAREAPADDGTWRVTADNGPFTYRLRPSPYPGKRDGSTIEDKVSNFIRRVRGKDEDRSKKLLGPVIVDAIRLEGESAGNVAGVHVGSKAVEVEDALGGPVPANGAVRYLGGGIEVGMRSGEVTYIEIRRNLDELVNRRSPALRPGEVTEIDYVGNRMKVRLGDGFQPLPGAELEVFVAGQELAAGRADYRAVVLDIAGNVANCKLVRKDKTGKIADDAEYWVLRSVPPGECGVVTVRPAAVL